MGRYYETDQRTTGYILRDKADTIGHRPFIRHAGRVFSYGEVDEMTDRYASGFVSLGIRHGSHVALMMPNCPEYFWALWGLGKIGAVAVPLNTAAKGDLLSYFLNHSDSTMLCVARPWLDRAIDALPVAAQLRQLLVQGALVEELDSHRFPPGLHVAHLEDFDTAPLHPTRTGATTRASDPHVILYTSGTTGPSKGAVSPHSQGHAVGHQMTSINGYRSDDVLYTCLPAFHANALWYTVYAALWAEASVALYEQFSARRFWAEIRESHATVFNCLGAMANIIWQQPDTDDDRRHRVRLCMMVPSSQALAAGFKQRYGITVTSVYAMTENCAVAAFGPEDPVEKAASAGRVRDYINVKVIGDDGASRGSMEVGEFLVRAKEPGIVMSGYYKSDEGSLDIEGHRWFPTGDRGYLDDDNFLFFSDRKKEAIRRRGENISAFEVETILCGHPAILEAAAVPVPSELGEDEVMVYLVVAPGQEVGFRELIAFSAERMPYFMVPRYMEFIDALPKTPSEKVEKYKLKLAATDKIDQLWDREAEGIILHK